MTEAMTFPERIREVVKQTILQILAERGRDTREVSDDQSLVETLGLKSLDLAQIVALLEDEFDDDPFAETIAITDIRTVGDLCDAYENFLSGDVERADDLDAGRQRAERRRAASKND